MLEPQKEEKLGAETPSVLELEEAIATLDHLFGPTRFASYAPEWEVIKKAALATVRAARA